jgi:hypothetical protein
MAHYSEAISTKILPNGNLKITANNGARAVIADAYREFGYQGAEQAVFEFLHERYDLVPPETVGALTDAPILCASDDIDYSDEGGTCQPYPDAAVFWFPDYTIRDPWAELKNKGVVVFRSSHGPK